MVVNEELTGIARPSDLVGLRFLEQPPLLVVEIMSPSDTRREIEEKVLDYRNIGVLECWLATFPTTDDRSAASDRRSRRERWGIWHG